MSPASSRSRISTIAAIAFAVAPWASLGFATPFSFGIAAALLRSWLMGAATVVFVFGFGAIFATAGYEDGTTQETIFDWALATNLVGGGVLAAVLTPFLVRRLSPAARAELPPDDILTRISTDKRAKLTHDPALRGAIGARERRRLAREILERDPRLAEELGIGRPQLRRGFDDGGLVDINTAPPSVLAELLGSDGQLVDRVMMARLRHGPFSSGAELVVHADVPSELVAGLSDRLVFRESDPG